MPRVDSSKGLKKHARAKTIVEAGALLSQAAEAGKDKKIEDLIRSTKTRFVGETVASLESKYSKLYARV